MNHRQATVQATQVRKDLVITLDTLDILCLFLPKERHHGVQHLIQFAMSLLISWLSFHQDLYLIYRSARRPIVPPTLLHGRAGPRRQRHRLGLGLGL